MKLNNKVVLVTGASRGIGRGIAIKLAENGATIIINYNKNKEEALITLEKLKKYSKESYIVKADISDYNAVEEMVSKALKYHKKIDILINNAGFDIRKSFKEISNKDWDKVLNINLRGYWICSKVVSREMIKNKVGRIINISSIQDTKPFKTHGPYCVSKAGIKMLTKSLALELAEYGILVNSISPGAINTDMNREALSDKTYRKKIIDRIPLRRIGNVNDVSGTVLFLCSEDANYITGMTIYVDGGYLLT